MCPMHPSMSRRLLKSLSKDSDVDLRFRITLLDGKNQTDPSHSLQLGARSERSAARETQ